MSNVSFSSIISQSRASNRRQLDRTRRADGNGDADQSDIESFARVSHHNHPVDDNVNWIQDELSQYSLLNEMQGPRSRSSSKQPSQKSSVPQNDVWNRLYQQEKNSRIKYFDTPKNLLAKLEQEQQKYIELEEEYKRFSRESLRERDRLARDLKIQKDQRNRDINEMKAQLARKEQEHVSTHETDQAQLENLHDTIAELKAAHDRLLADNSNLQKVVNEHELASKEQKHFASRILEDKKKLQDEVKQMNDELGSTKRALSDSDAGWFSEKELRMKQDVHIVDLEHAIKSRENECKDLLNKLTHCEEELQELQELRQVASHQKKIIEQITAREKDLCERLEDMAIHQKDHLHQIRELEGHERRYLVEIQRLSHVESALRIDIEQLKVQNSASAAETKEWIEKHSQKTSRCDELSLALDKVVSDLDMARKQLQEAKYEFNDTESRFSSLVKELREKEYAAAENSRSLQREISRNVEESGRLKSHIQSLITELQSSESVVEKLNQQLKFAEEEERSLRQHHNDLSSELENERSKVQGLKSALNAANSDIKQLQNEVDCALQDSDALKGAYDSKIRLLMDKHARLKRTAEDYANTILKHQENESRFQQLLSENANALSHAKEDLKFVKSNLEQAVAERDQILHDAKEDRRQLRDQINEIRAEYEEKLMILDKDRKERIETLMEKIRFLDSQLESISSDRDRIMQKTDHVILQREIASLKQTIDRRDEDIKLLQLKYRNASEQVKRMELEQHRSFNNTDNNMEHVTGLTERLRNEVQQLMGGREKFRTSLNESKDIRPLPIPRQETAADKYINFGSSQNGGRRPRQF
eukprot:Partr_v1_DN28873_c0_g1_i1_m33153